MNVSVRRERRKQPIRRSVTSAIELYLGDLDGHRVNDLYHVVQLAGLYLFYRGLTLKRGDQRLTP